jgi:hypothetical protein
MSYQDENSSEADEWTVIDLLMLIVFVCILGPLMKALTAPAPSKGYGGSPGHMSPMEVEEMYEKNKK